MYNMVKEIKKLLEEYEGEEEKEEIAAKEKPKKKRHEIITKEIKSFKKIKLDAYDKKILELLLENCRESLNIIARKVRLSRENVDYRIKRIIKDGLIKEFITVFNTKKLGLEYYVVFLELVNLDENIERKMLNYLKESEHASWIGTSAGKWSLVFDVMIREKSEFEETNGFFIEFSKFIANYVILSVEENEYFPLKVLGLKFKERKLEKTRDFKLDKIDFKLLSMLNESAWASYVQMASKVKLTPNAVNKRINDLENSGVISNYTISLNWKKLDWEWYGLQLKVTKLSKDIHNKLIKYFRENPKVLAYNKYFGGVWDYDAGIIARNSEELREFINDFRKVFSDFVKISDVFINLDETTVYKLPKGVFDNCQ